jgi:hypothetical protein
MFTQDFNAKIPACLVLYHGQLIKHGCKLSANEENWAKASENNVSEHPKMVWHISGFIPTKKMVKCDEF